MELGKYNEAKDLRTDIDMLKSQRSRLYTLIEKGSCQIRAVIEYKSGGLGTRREAIINDKEIIIKAAEAQLLKYDVEIEQLEQQFERL